MWLTLGALRRRHRVGITITSGRCRVRTIRRLGASLRRLAAAGRVMRRDLPRVLQVAQVGLAADVAVADRRQNMIQYERR